MKKINCIIADDELLARKIIKGYADQLDRLEVVAVCANGLEVYAAVKTHPVDLLFLDIQMPQLTGIELLRTLKNPPQVIFTTAYSEFAIEGYELNVIDYLLKPISFERFLKAVEKYENRLIPGNLNQQTPPPEQVQIQETFIYVKSDKKMVRIVLKDILYIEGLKDYIRIITATNKVITYQTLNYFEERLPEGQFMRVHRSFIISLNHINFFSASELTIGNNTIPIGSTYLKAVLKKLNLSA